MADLNVGTETVVRFGTDWALCVPKTLNSGVLVVKSAKEGV